MEFYKAIILLYFLNNLSKVVAGLPKKNCGNEPWECIDGFTRVELNCKCGRKKLAAGKIVGGEITQPYEFPWLTFLLRSNNKGTKSGCGSVIINNRLILTAGHCVSYIYKENPVIIRRLIPVGFMKIYAHIYNRHETRNASGNYKKLTIDRVIVHPKYLLQDDPEAHYANYDIALILLNDTIDITNSDFTPVCLPTETDIIRLSEGTQAVVTGWGIYDRDIKMGSNYTRKITVPVHSDENCHKYATESNTSRPDLFICADKLDKTGAAEGDSGGPLMIETSPNEFLQIGVVSHGTAKNIKDFLYSVTFYTRVTAFIKWILYHSAGHDAYWCERMTPPK